MHRHASSMLLLNCLRNYLKYIKKTFVRHAKVRFIYITAASRFIFHYKQKSNKQKYIIIIRIPKIIIKNFYFFFSLQYIIMSRKNISFDDKKIKKSDFYQNKKINKINDINVNNILVSKKELCGTKNSFKYFIGYNDNDIIRPLCIRLPQMTGYVRKFNENSTMSFRVEDKQLLKNYNKIWEKTE